MFSSTTTKGEMMHDIFRYSKTNSNHQTTVTVGSAVFGGSRVVMIAGPCAAESYEQLFEVAQVLKELGIPCLRAGVFKPRTSPYSFQGMGEEGLVMLDLIRRKTGLVVITEVMSIEQMAMAAPYVDCFQVGSRNMHNFELLKALGCQLVPVLLKRGLAATVDEFLLAAEYILMEGNSQVILCERGIRSFDSATRNVLDLASVALLKELTHLPVIVDPSHATGRRSLIEPAARAAVAVGADGIMVEAHPDPMHSVSDADQAVSLEELAGMMPRLEAVAGAVGRTFEQPIGALV
jgi:3-deoxy-7-phosphoheptulonate synthase